MASQYNLTLANGSSLGSIQALEGNGPNAQSIPRQVVDISFELAGNYFVVADDVTARFIPNFGFSVIGGTAYDGAYTVHSSLPTTFTEGNTRIPVNQVISPNLFNIIGVTTGVNGVFSIEGASNGNFVFYPGSIFTIAGNSFPATNGAYTVSSVATSGSYNIIGVVTGASGVWTITGNYAAFLQPGVIFSVSHNTGGGATSYTVASVAVIGPNTAITVVGSIVGTAGSNGVVTPTPARTRITVTGSIVAGAAANGTATPAAISQLPITNIVSVTMTAPSTFNVIWRVSGNHTAKFTPGTPFLVKGNNILPYNILIVVSSTFNAVAGLTEIVTVMLQDTTPTPTTTGNILFPAPSVPFGFVTYDIPTPLTALELIGKGSPYFNNTITWGNALQNNSVRMLEHFSHTLPPIAPLSGQLWFDPSVPALQLAGSSKYTIIGVNTTTGVWTVSGNQTAVTGLQIGKTVVVYNDTGLSAISFVYTVTAIAATGPNTNITVSPAIGVAAVGNGVLYSYDDWHGVVAEGYPVQGNLDMNNYSVARLTNAVTTYPYVASLTGWGNNDQEALNLRTGDTLYIAKTGGSSATASVRSGTMTGSLNINGASPGGASAIGLNVNSAPISMYATSGLDFKAAGSGNITFEATTTGGINIVGSGGITVAVANITATAGNVVATAGNIIATAGNMRVGSGTNQVVTQNNAGVAPTITFTTATTGNNVINLNTNMLTGLSNAVGVTDAVSLQFADARYVNTAGDTMTGFLTLNADPTAALHSATKAYVDMFVSGIIWISPMLDPNLFNDVLSAPPVIDAFTAYHKSYIVAGTGTGAWAGFNGHLMTYDGVAWQSVLGRAVIIGDRLGVFVEPDNDESTAILPAGGLTGHAGKIATVATVSPYTYTFYTPAEPDAISVKGIIGNVNAYQSPHMGHNYTFRGTHGMGVYRTGYAWIEFSGPGSLVDGGGLRYVANVLNVGAGTGIVVNADDVALSTSNVLSLFNLATTGIVARTAANTVTSRTITGTASNIVVADGDGVAANPTVNLATVTQGATGTAFSKFQLDTFGRVINNTLVLTSDITALVDATYVNVSGDTMTGLLSLSADPTLALHAATKQYVDAGRAVAGAGLTKTGFTIDVIGTANRIVVSADAIDIGTDVVTLAGAQTLTNKLISGGQITSAVASSTTTSGLTTATTTVVVSAATAPIAGQVLTATSGTAAAWSAPTASGLESTFLLMGA